MRTTICRFNILIAFIILNFQHSIAQLYVQGTSLIVQNNALVFVDTTLETDKPSTIAPVLRNWGTIAVTGNTQFHADTDYKGQGDLCLLGNTQQTITTNGIPLKKLDIRNSNNVELGDSVNIQGELKLTDGFLLLGNHNLVIDDSVTLSGGSDTSYIRMNGTGRLTTTVGSSPVTLPIGRNPYLPIVIDDGGGEEYTVGVSQNVYDNPVTQSGLKSSNVVGETWTIQSSSSVNNVSVTLQWDAAEEETGFTRGSCMIGFWENSVSTAWNSGGTNSAASGSDPYTQTRTVDFTTNLFYFGVGSGGSALPVELTYFTAHWQEQGKTAQLSWQTAMEENNSHFEIERSFDGTTWESIGRVEGQGNTFDVMDYQFVDQLEIKNSKLETIYYRLKQVDYNGAYEYSPVRSLKFEQATLNTFSIYPNPSEGNTLNFTVPGIYSLYNTKGQLLLKGIETNRMDISTLPDAVYLIKNERGVIKRFVKN